MRSAFKAKFKVKLKTFQSMANILPPRVSVLDQLGPTNTDLREFLSNKRKFHSGEQVHISSSQCGQAECHLVTVHSVNRCLGPILAIPSPNKLSIFDRLSAQTPEGSKSGRKRKAKKPHLAAASVNMTGRGKDSMQSRRGRQGFTLLS